VSSGRSEITTVPSNFSKAPRTLLTMSFLAIKPTLVIDGFSAQDPAPGKAVVVCSTCLSSIPDTYQGQNIYGEPEIPY
jgi:hypothetical protein